jgi:hypothetical protein
MVYIKIYALLLSTNFCMKVHDNFNPWIQAKKISEQILRRGPLSPELMTRGRGGAQLPQVEGEEMLSSSSIKYHSPTVAPVFPAETIEKVEEPAPAYEQEDWPHQEECMTLTSADYFPSVFLPPENKGFE